MKHTERLKGIPQHHLVSSRQDQNHYKIMLPNPSPDRQAPEKYQDCWEWKLLRGPQESTGSYSLCFLLAQVIHEGDQDYICHLWLLLLWVHAYNSLLTMILARPLAARTSQDHVFTHIHMFFSHILSYICILIQIWTLIWKNSSSHGFVERPWESCLILSLWSVGKHTASSVSLCSQVLNFYQISCLATRDEAGLTLKAG